MEQALPAILPQTKHITGVGEDDTLVFAFSI